MKEVNHVQTAEIVVAKKLQYKFVSPDIIPHTHESDSNHNHNDAHSLGFT